MKTTCTIALKYSVFGTVIGMIVASTYSIAETNPYGKWENGPPKERNYFPIAVWLQNPRLASEYKKAGINLYVGLWKGPTEAQLDTLRKHGMPVICSQNKVGLEHKDDSIIVGWMHGDEPDNAQPLKNGKGYGPPISPQKIIEDYNRLHTNDPSRPVLLNLGQGVAWDNWHGRGIRTNKPEDYPEYIKGGDIVSFDIYPVVHRSPEIQGKLWYVPYGVDRLRKWSNDRKIVWNCIECTRIHSPDKKPTPHQVKAEVWMSLIHGSMGLIYFVHEWQPKFNEHALLDDAEMLEEVTAINRQIHNLAPVLNSPSIKDAAMVESSNKVPVDIMVKKSKDRIYLFAVCMRDNATYAKFSIKGIKGNTEVQVLGENRMVEANNGKFSDEFKPWDVHIYLLNENSNFNN